MMMKRTCHFPHYFWKSYGQLSHVYSFTVTRRFLLKHITIPTTQKTLIKWYIVFVKGVGRYGSSYVHEQKANFVCLYSNIVFKLTMGKRRER
jgi:hypothetical protein